MVFAFAWAPLAKADELVTAWNETMLQAVRIEKSPPPVATRAFAMVHIAMFDAVNAFERQYEPYAFHGAAPRFASPDAAAAAAAHRVLTALFPAEQASFDQLLAESLQGIAPLAAAQGTRLGRLAADRILLMRRRDRWDRTVPYTPGTYPGAWQPTPPAYAPALLPQWGQVVPFAMNQGKSFRPVPPPALDSLDYAVSFEEVRLLGSLDNSIRTAEQTEIAYFWADGAGTETPPGHWNRIAQGLADDSNLSLLETTRLFALLNIATADAAICAWDAKFYFDFWRPITGIRLADLDGNGLTQADPTWAPLLVTPPFPSYTSGHSTFSGASAAVLANYFGSDEIPFSTTSDGLPGVIRSFDRFSQAAEEAGQSRIYGGIHWQFDNLYGLLTGGAIGDYVCESMLGSRPSDQ
jgi:hypothetical protein